MGKISIFFQSHLLNLKKRMNNIAISENKYKAFLKEYCDCGDKQLCAQKIRFSAVLNDAEKSYTILFIQLEDAGFV